MTNACKELHCLPSPGGWFDQDCFHVEGMDIVIMEQHSREAHERHQQELKANRNRR